MSSILKTLASENFITVNRTIADLVGLDAAVVLGELVSEHLYWESHEGLKDGFFFSTVENLADKTYLSAYNQRQALDRLKEAGFIEIKRKGMPAKRFIKINDEVIEKAIFVDNKLLKNLTTSCEKIDEQVVKKFDRNKNIEKKTEEKEKGYNKALAFDDLFEQVPIIAQNPELRETLHEFIKMRQKIKAPMTERAVKMIVNESYKLAEGNAQAMTEILNQSIVNCWKGVYPLKPQNGAQVRSPGNNNPFTALLNEEAQGDAY